MKAVVSGGWLRSIVRPLAEASGLAAELQHCPALILANQVGKPGVVEMKMSQDSLFAVVQLRLIRGLEMNWKQLAGRLD
jgi:hypothetical protein